MKSINRYVLAGTWAMLSSACGGRTSFAEPDATQAGGSSAVGGSNGVGGDTNLGGGLTTGGRRTIEATQTATGGSVTTGGVAATGGKVPTGGSATTGGSASAGGRVSTGGFVATGGASVTGGSKGTGGSLATGGKTSSVPSSWTCGASHYGTNDGCDCGCGQPDPDCEGATVRAACSDGNLAGSCGAKSGWALLALSPTDNSQCVPAPNGWTCAPAYFGDGSCDCGCGVKDSDCANDSRSVCEACGDPGSCSPYDWASNCVAISVSLNSTCMPQARLVPASWRCNPDYYGMGDGCDCGCGVLDPDCTGKTPQDCQTCEVFGSCAFFPESCNALDAMDNSKCSNTQWNCDPDYYGTDDGCDCGCGRVDPDCANATSSACEFCVSFGSCAKSCVAINPNDNSTCSD